MAENIVGSIFVKLGLKDKDFKKELNNSVNNAASVAEKQGGALITAAFSKMGKIAAGAFVATFSVKFAKEAMSLGSDLAEVQNVVDSTFGNMSGAADEWAKNAIENYGLSETSAKRYMGYLGAMGKSMGFANSEALEMAQTLTGLAGDVASFYNMDAEEAYTKLKGVFTGETEGLKGIGVVMTQAALDQFALANGYAKTTAQMTEQEKVALRYAYVQQALNTASGDFVRTGDSYANQLRKLTENFNALKAQIGQGLIAAVTPILKVLNAIISKLITVATLFNKVMQRIFGKKAVEGSGAVADEVASMSVGFSDAGKEAKKMGKALKGSLAGFDEINTLSISSSSGENLSGIGGGSIPMPAVDTSAMDEATGSIKDKFDEMIDNFISKIKGFYEKWIRPIIDGIVSFWNEHISPILEEIKNKAIEIWEGIIQPIINKIVELAQYVWSVLQPIFQAIWNEIGPVLGKYFTDAWNTISTLATDIWTTISTLFGDIWKTIESTWEDISNLFGSVIDTTKSIIELFVDFFTGNWDELWEDVKTIFSNAWKVIENLFMTIKNFIENIFHTVIDFVMNIIKGIWDWIKNTFTTIKNAVMGVFSAFINWIKTWWNTFSTNVKTSLTKIKETITEAFNKVKEKVITIFTNIKTKLSSIVDDIKSKFKSGFEALVNIVKWPVNQIIRLINSLIRGLNRINVDFPDWVPGLGGKSLGFHIPEIPMLAQGAYVEANTPQLAMIGDNRHQGEFVAPEGKLISAVNVGIEPLADALQNLIGVLGNVGNQGNIEITVPVYLDGNKLEQFSVNAGKINNLRTGGYR